MQLDPGFAAAAAARGLTDRTARLLASRGHGRAEDLAAFFDAPAAGLHDPRRLPDADRVRQRIARARRAGEGVLVFGDFDADGLTGLAILTLTLRRLGLDAEPYVPDRLMEGHGLSLAAVEHARASGRTLIVTVDTGSTSAAEIAAANAVGLDVIVTDHHHVPAVMPLALAVVNPHRADSDYPDSRLAGTGVAFKVAQLLLADEPGGEAAALELTDLATIGTVADVAPIVGENRAIARLGLERLRGASRPGIAALLAVARVAPAAVDLETLAFSIAPRLNAGGRMGDARTAARLLLAADAAEAEALAATLEAANRSRRELTATALGEAREAVGADPAAPLVVVAGAWPVGVIGLVAGRLAEELGRAAIVVSTAAEPWRASARGDGVGLDLAAAFEACDDLLERHGGHPQAAGCQFRPPHFGELRERLMARAAAAGPVGDGRPELALDLTLVAGDVDYRLHRELAALAPCGPGNPVPQLGVSGLRLVRARPAAGKHASLTLGKGHEVLDGIAFDRADLLGRLAEGDDLDVVARLASRSFGGHETLQLEILDVAPGGHIAALAAAGGASPAAVPIAAGGRA